MLLVDDHALLRTGVANIINQEPDLHVIAEAGNGVEALDAYDLHHPDVTLLDLRMPVMEGVEVVRRIRERDPQARVIILTTYDTDDEISRALKAGAKAYVLKDISADDLINCIRDVLAGKSYLAPAAAAKLAEGVTRVQLTPREMATLTLLADGKANKEIATALEISERTVKSHLAHLFEKLGATSRTEAVKVATRRGLVRLDLRGLPRTFTRLVRLGLPRWYDVSTRSSHGRHPTTHERLTELPWDASYDDGPAPWDIDQPQPVIVRVASEVGFAGTVLDAGCGTARTLGSSHFFRSFRHPCEGQIKPIRSTRLRGRPQGGAS